MNSTTIQILTEASAEIRRLRRQNEILNAKVEVMDLFACVLHTNPAQHTGGVMGVDIAWQMDKEAARLKLPICPDCHSNANVTLSPPESAVRGEYFCPCNEPGQRASGHFNVPALSTEH